MLRRCSRLLPLARRTRPVLRSANRRHIAHIPHGKIWVPENFSVLKKLVKPVSRLIVSNGPWNYREHEYEELDDYLQKNPILHKVTSGRLIVANPSQPYMMLEDSDQLIRSGLVMIKASHELGINTKGLFTKENVRVLTRMNVFGLNQVDLSIPHELTKLEKQDNFSEYWDFVREVIKDVHGVQALQLLPHDLVEVGDLIKLLDTDENLVELLVNNAGFLPRQSKAILLRRIYNIIMQRIPELHKENLPVEGFVPVPGITSVSMLGTILLAGMPYCEGVDQNELWGTVIAPRNDVVFKVWTTAANMQTDSPENLLKMLRHGVSHPLEKKMVQAILKLIGDRPSLMTNPPTFSEVVDLFDYSFSRLPPMMVKVFWDNGVYNWLKMPALFPLPSFYY